METTYALNENETLQEIKRPPRIGFIKTFAGTTPPEGTLLCDGSAVSRDTYSDLFDVIGTTWGEGDGETTFNLPDLRGKWLMGADAERAAGTEVAEGLPDISGWFYNITIINSHGVVYSPSGVFSQEARVSPGTGSAAQATGDNIYVTYFNADQSSPIYGAQDHVTPASVAVLPCIVYE